MTHQDPMVVQRRGCPTSVEYSWVLLQDSLKLFQVSWVSLGGGDEGFLIASRYNTGILRPWFNTTITYSRYSGQDCLFLLTPESIIEGHRDHSRMEGPHGLHCQQRDTRGVEQSMPTLLHLLQGEAAGEVHSQVNSHQVVGLLYSTD